MEQLVINPRYRDFLGHLGLFHAKDFLELPGVIIGGHPMRHVVRVRLGAGAGAISAYLKKEHRVALKDRCINACEGFGFVSKSWREALTLEDFRRAGIRVPEVLAVGSDGAGQAFILLREVRGAVDSRLFLRDHLPCHFPQRRAFFEQLGKTFARFHAAGFEHGDLYSKHLLVRPNDQSIFFLDCQRGRQFARLTPQRRAFDLGALDATLADDLASAVDRWVFLKSYLRCANQPMDAKTLARAIRERSRRLRRRRRVNELRQPPLPAGKQNLIWLDGESLCVTREFHETLGSTIAPWLRSSLTFEPSAATYAVTEVRSPSGLRGNLIRRRARQPLRWLLAKLRRGQMVSSEFSQASLLFRLQRHGIVTPRLLAVGHRHYFAGRVDSFLLVEKTNAVPLSVWLARHHGIQLWTCQQKERWHLLREAGTLIRRLVQAGCRVEPHSTTARGYDASFLEVRSDELGRPTVGLARIDGVRKCRRQSIDYHLKKCAALMDREFSGLLSATDQMRLTLAYFHSNHLTSWMKHSIRHAIRRRRVRNFFVARV